MLTIQHCQECLCRSYLSAVTARARHNLWLHPEHDYSVDGTFKQVGKRGNRILETGFALDFQAKASVNWTRENDEVVYDLEAHAYNDLVQRSNAERATPFVGVLLCLPESEDDWL